MRLVLVRQGTIYGPEYVSKLPEAVTLTDQDDTPGETRPLVYGLNGWWAKMEMFAPENRDLRPFLYLDLDSFVFASLEKYQNGNLFTMVEDFYQCCPANSCVMWVPEDVDHIWETFSADPHRHMAENRRGGDQLFLSRFAQHLWRDDGIVSYKQHGTNGPVGTIMQFHGKPKPPDATGWARDHWLKI